MSADSKTAKRITEAAKRAEVTALLLRLGYRLYRPEVDVHGEDLVVRRPDGELIGVQLKGRPFVHEAKYGGRGLWMLFPSAKFDPAEKRDWFLVPHDDLFAWFKERHGHTPGWQKSPEWNTGKPSKVLLAWLAPYESPRWPSRRWPPLKTTFENVSPVTRKVMQVVPSAPLAEVA